jgi:Replication protein
MSSVASRADKATLTAADFRDSRFQAQHILWDESSLNSVRHCGRSLSKHSGDGQTVAVKMSEGRAGFAGLQSCGSPWACPVCSGKIAPVRAGEIQSAVDAWHKRGGRVVFHTFTMRHKSAQTLEDLWDGLSHAWAKVTSGSSWERDSDKYGGQAIERTKTRQLNKVKYKEVLPGNRINFIRAVEVTHGDNGWHVHIHALMFVHENMTQRDADALGLSMFGRWKRALVNKGFVAPTIKRGIDSKLVPLDGSVPLGEYFAKAVYGQPKKKKAIGFEVAGGMSKVARRENRTPFQILADIVALGDEDDLKRWYVFEQSSKGRRQITWSHGFRDLLGLNVEKTDEEIAAEDNGGDVVMTFLHTEWQELKLYRYKGRILTLVELGCSKKQLMKILRETVNRS